jgi:hypothetical protein
MGPLVSGNACCYAICVLGQDMCVSCWDKSVVLYQKPEPRHGINSPAKGISTQPGIRNLGSLRHHMEFLFSLL